jgi:DNA-directed RNA polymerase specialized sigma24 family protein
VKDPSVTRLLQLWSEGDESALERLLPLVEAELRRLARGYMGRERRDHTLQTTALVNEAFVRLDRALDKLAAVDQRKSRVVELRFFGGLSVEETADVLRVSSDTIKRDWRLARLWLLREIEGTRRE